MSSLPGLPIRDPASRHSRVSAGSPRYGTNRYQDEGTDTYLRIGEVLQKIGREDGVYASCETGILQAERFGPSGMVEDLHMALVMLGERRPRTG